jgi:hypothetical protein
VPSIPKRQRLFDLMLSGLFTALLQHAVEDWLGKSLLGASADTPSESSIPEQTRECRPLNTGCRVQARCGQASGPPPHATRFVGKRSVT